MIFQKPREASLHWITTFSQGHKEQSSQARKPRHLKLKNEVTKKWVSGISSFKMQAPCVRQFQNRQSSELTAQLFRYTIFKMLCLKKLLPTNIFGSGIWAHTTKSEPTRYYIFIYIYNIYHLQFKKHWEQCIAVHHGILHLVLYYSLADMLTCSCYSKCTALFYVQ